MLCANNWTFCNVIYHLCDKTYNWLAIANRNKINSNSNQIRTMNTDWRRKFQNYSVDYGLKLQMSLCIPKKRSERVCVCIFGSVCLNWVGSLRLSVCVVCVHKVNKKKTHSNRIPFHQSVHFRLASEQQQSNTVMHCVIKNQHEICTLHRTHRQIMF